MKEEKQLRLGLIGIFQDLPLPVGYDFTEAIENVEGFITQASQEQRESLVKELGFNSNHPKRG